VCRRACFALWKVGVLLGAVLSHLHSVYLTVVESTPTNATPLSGAKRRFTRRQYYDTCIVYTLRQKQRRIATTSLAGGGPGEGCALPRTPSCKGCSGDATLLLPQRIHYACDIILPSSKTPFRPGEGCSVGWRTSHYRQLYTMQV
jgi:hypothetical protein